MSHQKICILQMTRIGDILQSYQAARQLKLENPNISLSLIARRDMAKGLIFILQDTFDDIFLFETSDFFPVGTKTLGSAKENLNGFLNEVNELELDLIVNFSYSSSSSYLMNLIESKHKMGIKRSSKNELVIDDRWSQYVYSNILDSTHCPFNLVDIYKNILGAKDNHSFPVTMTPTNTITLHPFASDKTKCWEPHRWSELIFKLLKSNPTYSVTILGAKADIANAELITLTPTLKEFSHRINNQTSKLNIEESFNEVKNSKLFIGHDSMVSHLASIAEKESIIISLGPVKPHETSPYCDKVVNIASTTSCSDTHELKDINPQLINFIANEKLASRALTSESLKTNVNTFSLQGIKIYNSKFDLGGLRLNNLLEDTCSSQDVMRKFLRICFSYYLNDLELEMSIPKLNQESIHTLRILKDGMEYMNELFHHAMITCNAILEETSSKKSDTKNIQQQIKKLAEIDKLLLVTVNKYKLLKPVHDFFYINRLNSKGKDLAQITQSNLVSYYEAQNFLSFVEDLTNTTLGPKIIDRNTTKDI